MNKKKEVKKMIERVEKELKGLANRLKIEEEEMLLKYNEIASANGIDVNEERQQLVALTLVRNHVRGVLSSNRSSTTSTGYGNHGHGFFVAIEPTRDIMEWRRKTVMNKYRSDSSQALNDEIVAEIVLEEGNYVKTQVLNGEWETKTIGGLPPAAMETGDNTWIVPVDAVKTWASGDKNKNYGRPLPKEQFQLRAHFVGAKQGEDYQLWTLQLKNEAAKNFKANTFEWVTLYGIFNDERNAIYGIQNKTLQSLTALDNLDSEDPRFADVSDKDIETLLVECMAEYLGDLMELDSFHEMISQKQGTRLIVTDGIVTSQNLTVNEKTGNRVMWIEPLDASYGFDDDDIPDSTPVWIPSNIKIDFGAGSDVIIVGRTNQTQKKDDDGMPIDGEYNPVSINLYGVFARTSMGAVEEVEDAGEDLNFW